MGVFQEGKFELLALMETKLKEASWCEVNSIIAGGQEMERVRVIIMLNDVWQSAVTNFGCVNSKSSRLNLKFSRDKVCVVVGYGLNDGDGEEMYRFWNDIGKDLDRVGNGYRVCILGELNGWIGDRTKAGITGASGVPGENANGRGVVEFFAAERGLPVDNTCVKQRGLYKYTKVASCQDGVEL